MAENDLLHIYVDNPLNSSASDGYVAMADQIAWDINIQGTGKQAYGVVQTTLRAKINEILKAIEASGTTFSGLAEDIKYSADNAKNLKTIIDEFTERLASNDTEINNLKTQVANISANAIQDAVNEASSYASNAKNSEIEVNNKLSEFTKLANASETKINESNDKIDTLTSLAKEIKAKWEIDARYAVLSEDVYNQLKADGDIGENTMYFCFEV